MRKKNKSKSVKPARNPYRLQKVILYCRNSPEMKTLICDLITHGYRVEEHHHENPRPLAILNGSTYVDFFAIRTNLLHQLKRKK